MSSRMLAPHTTCPACREEVFLDELVRGRCPLCGCSLEDYESSTSECEEFAERGDFSWLVFNYFIFRKFERLGVSPLQVMQLVSGFEESGGLPTGKAARFRFDVPMGAVDRLFPKRCAKCGKLFMRGGSKMVEGDLGKNTEVTSAYHCPHC